MTRNKLGGNRNGLGFYELMTAPERVYIKALVALEEKDLDKFYEILGVNTPNSFKGGRDGHNLDSFRTNY